MTEHQNTGPCGAQIVCFQNGGDCEYIEDVAQVVASRDIEDTSVSLDRKLGERDLRAASASQTNACDGGKAELDHDRPLNPHRSGSQQAADQVPASGKDRKVIINNVGVAIDESLPSYITGSLPSYDSAIQSFSDSGSIGPGDSGSQQNWSNGIRARKTRIGHPDWEAIIFHRILTCNIPANDPQDSWDRVEEWVLDTWPDEDMELLCSVGVEFVDDEDGDEEEATTEAGDEWETVVDHAGMEERESDWITEEAAEAEVGDGEGGSEED